MKWYLLRRKNDWHFHQGKLSTLRGYEDRVAGYESWDIVYSHENYKNVENYYFKEVTK